MAKRSMYVGMDVHKESIDLSLAEAGRDGEVRHYGVIPGDLEAVAKVVRALRAPRRRLRFVYEARPVPSDQVPFTTVMFSSVGCVCGRVMYPAS